MSTESDADDAPPPPTPPPPPPPPPAPPPPDPVAPFDASADLPTGVDAPIAGVELDVGGPPPPAAVAPADSTAAEAPPPPPPPPPPAATPPPPAMPDAASGPGITDPFGIGSAVGRLSGGARSQGHAAFMVLACSLDPDESAQLVVHCRYNGAAGALALTDRRLLVVNAREWEPDVTTIDLEPGLTVQGWQDGNHAALVFEREGAETVVDRIADGAVAQEIAAAVRGRSGS